MSKRQSDTEIERRYMPAELRIEGDESPKITGYAAVFDVWADINGWFREKIAPGAFKNSLKKDDVRALMNHDSNFVLGRNKAGTLRLAEDKKGLAVEIDPTPTTWANDLMISMKRGDISQMSFGFTVNKAEDDYNEDTRILKDVNLFDVSIVTFPAYPTTSAEVRSLFGNAEKIVDWSALDAIITRIKAGEELTEDEVRFLMEYIPKEDELNPRELERALRDAGCSRTQAKEILAKGLIAPDERDAQEEEEVPPRDAEPAKEDRVSDLLTRAELAAPSQI